MNSSLRNQGLSRRAIATSASGRFWVFAQFTTPFLFAGMVAFAVWSDYRPVLTSGEDVFNHLMVCITASLVYLAIQGFAVVLQPVGSDVRPLMDVLTSLLPVLVIAFAVERYLTGYLALDFYQIGVLWISGFAALIDLTCFTLFAMKVNRLAPDVVLTN